MKKHKVGRLIHWLLTVAVTMGIHQGLGGISNYVPWPWLAVTVVLVPLTFLAWITWEFRVQGWLIKLAFPWWSPRTDLNAVTVTMPATVVGSMQWVVLSGNLPLVAVLLSGGLLGVCLYASWREIMEEGMFL